MSSPGESQTLRFPAPAGPPPTWDIESLKIHLKTAMAVELTTIPLYLCAIYSIIDGKTLDPYKEILIISKQEMLHLTLAGNMLRAIGGNQVLYDKNFIPTFPGEIFYDKVKLKLGPADEATLKSFIQVERPNWPIPTLYTTLLQKYRSIGEFYDSVEDGIKKLCPDGSDHCDLFRHNHDKQFGDTEIFKHSGAVAVKDRASALAALNKIVVQGEGADPDDPKSHYNIFTRLHKEHEKWKCYDYLEDPKTAKYSGTPLVHRLSLAFDALYCYLLQTIDRAWETSNEGATAAARKHLIDNIRKIMLVMSDLAGVLVAQKLPSGKSPAPCFEFYPADGSPLSPEDLFAALKAEIKEATEASDAVVQNSDLKDVAEKIDDCKPTES